MRINCDPKRILHLVLTVGAALLFSPPAQAQFETATVLGTVRDVNEAVATGATVTLTNVETGSAATTTTDDGGVTSIPASASASIKSQPRGKASAPRSS